MAWPGGPSGDDRPPDPFSNGPGEEGPLALSVPNDASELADEIAAYRREVRSRQRRERFDRLTLARYWRPYGITGPVVIAALVVIGSVGGLLLALLPNARQYEPQAGPLGNAVAPIGSEGGWLPDDQVYIDGDTESAQALRPAVIALVPADCGCTSTIDHVASQAGQFGLTTYVVTSKPNDPQMPSLLHKARGRTAVLDLGGKLALTYSPRDAGVTVLIVRGDGVLRKTIKHVSATTTMSGVLTLLDQSTA